MNKTRIESHPDFPFREGRDAALLAEEQEFLDAPDAGSEDQRALHEFIALAHQFAFLERLIQGDVLYELPVHAGVVAAGTGLAPEEEAERLAAGERELLDRMGGSADSLLHLLDEMGIKVLTLDESSEDSGSDLYGAFYYVGEVGPAILVGAPARASEAGFVLAHELAHLIADVDPYRPRFCRWHRGTLENRVVTPAEARADRFARALLIPEERLRQVLAALPSTDQEGPADPRWEQLSVFFGVSPLLVRDRLADLRLPALGPMPGRARETGQEENKSSTVNRLPAPDSGGTTVALPERFVNLALAAYSERVLDPVDLARFLRTTEPEVHRILAWARIPRRMPAEDIE